MSSPPNHAPVDILAELTRRMRITMGMSHDGQQCQARHTESPKQVSSCMHCQLCGASVTGETFMLLSKSYCSARHRHQAAMRMNMESLGDDSVATTPLAGDSPWAKSQRWI